MFFQESNDFALHDLRVGQIIVFPDEGILITRDMQDCFKNLSGNVQPIHTEINEHGTLVYGMLTGIYYSTLAGVFLPGKNALCHEMKISFNKPVYVGDKITITGKITEISEALSQITVKAQIKNQKNEIVSKSIMSIGVLDDE